ncbi:MAG: hypothetical protein UZ03_NOB001002243 [Nitrospira sp. OLB3]|nr:MAG: hypothetical protein UZ03_NOB001002243 [Nitrospira sp. OLB3]
MILTILAAAMATPAGPLEKTCASEARMDFVCGIAVPEDLIAIPDTPWVIATSMPRDGSAGGLYLIDSRTREARKLDLAPMKGAPRFASTAEEAAEAGRCAPLDPGKLLTHGISLSPSADGVHRLYVVGHGGREAIELFNVDARGSVPSVLWAGCVEMPAGIEANSVAGLPDGGLMFTTLYDPGETDWQARMAKLGSALPAGGVFEWHAGTGFSRLGIPPMSGPNGIAVSEDGRTVFLAGWGDRIVRRVDRAGKETAAPITLDFLPDNLHWTPDGALLASGQRETVQGLFSCSFQKDRPTYCSPQWAVARIDPASLTVTDNWRQDTGGAFGDSTAAIMVEGRLWIGAINGDRIGVVTPQKQGGE